MVHDQINPPADPWLQTGLVVSSLANLLGGGKRTYKPTHFVPRRKRAIDDSEERERHEKSLLTRFFSAMRKRKE